MTTLPSWAESPIRDGARLERALLRLWMARVSRDKFQRALDAGLIGGAS
jgi:hypothetical protein